MEIRVLSIEEYGGALELCRRVFMEFEAPDYSERGVEAFCASIGDADYIAGLRVYGAYEARSLIGVLAARSGGSHIALFFVEGEYHRRGVGRQLFLRAAADCPTAEMTVNSSPYAVEIYRRLGFNETDTERTEDGIRYTPMLCVLRREDCPCKRKRCSRHGRCFLCREHHRSDKQDDVFCKRLSREEKREKRRRERG